MRKLIGGRGERLTGLANHTSQQRRRGRASRRLLRRVMMCTASRQGYKNRERQSNTDNSLRAAHPDKDAITPPSVVLRLTGSRQGNRGPPLPPPLIGCLCWLRHTGLAGPGESAPRAGRWRRLLSCHSAAERQPLAWSPPPRRALGDCWMGGGTSGEGETEMLECNKVDVHAWFQCSPESTEACLGLSAVTPVFCWQLSSSLPLVLLESLYPSCGAQRERLFKKSLHWVNITVLLGRLQCMKWLV